MIGDALPSCSDRLIIERLGLVDYQLCLEHQKRLHQEVVNGSRPDTLILCTHPPVITTGTSTKSEHLLSTPEELAMLNLTPLSIGRGGSITYHGPEQLLAYPILNLKNHKTDVGWYMRKLEEVIIQALNSFSVQGFQQTGKTGVWVRPNAKIGFIGVKISRWCTFHGLSVNISRCAERFALINPCGLGDIEVTSIEEETGTKINRDECEETFLRAFTTSFNFKLVC